MENDAKEVMEALSSYANSFSVRHDDLIELVMRDHRTLQQNMMRLFLRIIEAWSEQESWDLRNEATIGKAKQIMEALDREIHLPFI